MTGGPDSSNAAGDPGDQLVEVVNRAGEVVDIVTRRQMRAQHLPHRCTYVAVVAVDPDPDSDPDSDDAAIDLDTPVVVHRRADWKDTCPGYWDVAFGGVCAVGEGWLESASRELSEEAGISGVELLDLGPVDYDDGDNIIVGRVYVARWSGPIRFDDGEVVAIDQVPIGRLRSWAAERSVCPDSLAAVIPRLDALAAGPAEAP